MLAPKKSLGQHFLHDENIARKIVEALPDGSPVVEIGPGQGDLTKHLTVGGRTVVGIEIDKRAVALLRERFQDSVTVVQGNILEVDFHGIRQRYGAKLIVVGNIPYYITSEILFRLFEFHPDIRSATLMMQVEVARRLVAERSAPGTKRRTKDYGILSVFTRFYTFPQLLFKVSRNSFAPKPKVDSAVVRLEFKDRLPDCDKTLFANVVRSTFGQRRKTLRNGLRSMGVTDLQLESLHFDLARRPETLDVNDFLKLTEFLMPFRESLSMRF
ncbi:MAG: 16S rRNA (adenine(1518)-N(6)/adenine(1519)-N(6))-dimethyltransferase RsmA [Bacteroidota bacterium]